MVGFEGEEKQEHRARTVVGYLLLLFTPIGLVLVFLAKEFHGLQFPTALDHAQLARNLVHGEGWVTNVIRPLSLGIQPHFSSHPDLYNPPFHPLVLALFFRLIQVSDKVSAGAGGILWILSVWLTFLLARRWFGPGPATLATAFYVSNGAILEAALNGLPQPLMSIGILLALGLAFPAGSKRPSPRFGSEDLRLVPSLTRKLSEAGDPLSQYLCEHLSPNTQRLLGGYDSAKPLTQELREALSGDLNWLLADPDLYDPQRFASISLTEEIQTLLEKNPRGEDRLYLHRLLLERAYPESFTRYPPDQEEGPTVPGWRWALVGLVGALATLTHYLLIAVPLTLGGYLWISQRSRKVALLAFLGGFLGPLFLWVGFYSVTMGSPFAGLFWYELLAHTRTYPGDSVWRLAVLPLSPFHFLFTQPGDLLHKMVVGLSQFEMATLGLLNRVVAFLFLVALPSPQENLYWRPLKGVVMVGMVLEVVLSCFFRPEPELLLAWAPLLALLAAAFLTDWAQRNIADLEWGRFLFPSWRMQSALYLGVVMLAFFPFFCNLTIFRSQVNRSLLQKVVSVLQQTSEDAVVMTDQPFPVAWWGERKAVWLLQQEEDWERLERTAGPVDAVYITPALDRMLPTERGEWWFWLSSPKGNYRDFELVTAAETFGVLRLRAQSEDISLGERKQREEDWQEKLQHLREQVRQNPWQPEVQCRLGEVYLQHDRLREATKGFQKALEQDSDHIGALLGMSIIALRAGYKPQALEWARKAQELQPENPGVLNNLGLVLMQVGQTEEAGQIFKQIGTLATQHPQVLLNVAQYWDTTGSWQQAETYYRQVAEAAPEQITPRLLLANLYLRRGRIDSALEELEALVPHHPDNATVQVARGRALQEKGQWEEARDAFTRARRLHPQWFLPYLDGAQVCRQLQDEAGGEQFLEQALLRASLSLPDYLKVAGAFINQRKPDRAMEVYEGLLKKYPRHPVVLNNLAYLYAEEGQHLDRAYQIAQKLVQINPQDGAAWDTLGWVCYRLGRLAEALKHIQEGIRLGPEKGIRYYHWGRALEAEKHPQEAAKALRQALSLGLSLEEQQTAEQVLQALKASMTRSAAKEAEDER